MSIPRKYDGIGNHHAYLAAIASAMGPAWSVSQEYGHHDLTDGTVWLRVSWHPQDQRLRFRGSYGQYRIVDTTAALTREPAAVARQLLARLESAGRAAKEATWQAARHGVLDLLAPFIMPPQMLVGSSRFPDPNAYAARTLAAGVMGTLQISANGTNCGLTLDSLTPAQVLEVLAALDESRLAEALAALLAVPAARPMNN